MPITSSAKKALRQNKRRKEQNLVWKVKVKKLVKQARELVSDKKQEQAKELLPLVFQALDKATKTGVIKKNAASRTKSRIAKLIDKAK